MPETGAQPFDTSVTMNGINNFISGKRARPNVDGNDHGNKVIMGDAVPFSCLFH